MKWCLLKYRLLEGKLPRTIQAEFVAAYAHPAPRVTQPEGQEQGLFKRNLSREENFQGSEKSGARWG